MTTFSTLCQRARKQVDNLTQTFGLDKELVVNIIQYARCLPKEGSSDRIDDLIFKAEMSNQFALSRRFLLTSMFSMIKPHEANTAHIDEFIKLICLFLCDKLELKIKWVFKVYDTNRDGSISWVEIYTLLNSCILDPNLEKQDLDDSLKELVGLVLKLTDIDMSSTIDLEEFRRVVKMNILFLEFLGPCLPGIAEVQEFSKKLTGKTPHQVRLHFAGQRSKSLGEYFPAKRTTKHYPFPLELP